MTEQFPTVRFTTSPDGAQANQRADILVTGNTGIEDITEDFRARVQFDIAVDGSRVASEEFDGLLQDETIDFRLRHPFGSGEHTITVTFLVDWYNVDGYAKNSGPVDGGFDLQASSSIDVTIAQETFTAGGRRLDREASQSRLDNAYEDFLDFEIGEITGSETGPTPVEIQFEYPNPAISIDTGGNFVTHDIIGGATVRQRIGDQPLEIGVGGVCTESTAQELELLRNVEAVTLFSNRFSLNSVRCHVASISTDPMEEGGAADMETGEFLYTFDLNCVEILDTGDI